MRTLDAKILEPDANDDSLVVKTMSTSSVVYKDNRVVCDKKLSHYLLSPYVYCDLQKKEHIDALQRHRAFK